MGKKNKHQQNNKNLKDLRNEDNYWDEKYPEEEKKRPEYCKGRKQKRDA